jgi:hypothetical protein
MVLWESTKYEVDKETDRIKVRKIGSFKQYPLKLAFAVSIHKSQGATFENLDIHFGYGAFASGQTYCAFSRCKTLEGIKLLKKLESRDIIIDPIVENFVREFVDKSLDNNKDIF